MKAFEKWSKNHKWVDYPLPPENGNNVETVITRETWKAALKWVLNDVVPEAWDTIDVQDFIEEELESE